MKINITIFAVSILLLIGATSCSEWLDIRPEGEIILDDYWQTESEAQAVMASCYRNMIQDGYIQSIFVWGEVRSDNVVEGSSVSDDLSKVLNQELTPTNSFTDWGSFYSVINICNTFIKYAPGAQEIDDNFTLTSLHSMEAEVLTLRALSYFYLIRAFDKVPYITVPSIDDAQNYLVGQTNQSVLLDSLLVDLEKAARYAAVRHTDNKNTKGRITQNGVYALMADIYLWKGDYSNCVIQCDKILNDKTLELVVAKDFFSSVFYAGNSTESIFELQFSNDNVQKNNTAQSYFGYEGNKNGSFYFPSILVTTQYSPFNYSASSSSIESENDIRLKDYIVDDPDGNTYKIFKYAGRIRDEDLNEKSTYKYRSNSANWIVYRLPDVILMKAEALVEQAANMNDSKVQLAMDMVNMTYLRSNAYSDSLKVTNYSGLADMKKLVLRERQRELLFEGKRFFDLMRLAIREKSTSQLTSYISKTSESTGLLGNLSSIESLYWPLNETELIANPTLKQNPFYETSTLASSHSN